MVDLKPLFDDENRPGDPAPIRVGPLDLPGDVAPPASPHAERVVPPLDLPDEAPASTRRPAVAPAIALHEHPFVAVAMARGETLFPDLMRERGFQVRNLLSDLLPVDFARLLHFADATLRRVAALVEQVAELDRRFHTVDVENLVGGIVEQARSHAAHARTSILGLLSGLVPFDEPAARLQIETIRAAIEPELAAATDAARDATRLAATLAAEVAVLAILADMGERGSLGDLITRRSTLLAAAKQQLDIVQRQLETLQLLARQWIMRCDEVRMIILPALGFGNSL